MLQCWVGSCDEKLLPRVFQLLPTTCNKSNVRKEMNNKYEEIFEVAQIENGGPWGNEG